MDRICLVLPILSGKTEDARAFQHELDGPRKREYELSERRIGIDREFWFLASAPSGDQFVASWRVRTLAKPSGCSSSRGTSSTSGSRSGSPTPPGST
jgi:hypothetical protein